MILKLNALNKREMSKNKLSESYQIRSSALKQRNIDIFHEHFPHLREEKLEACK